MLTTDDVEGRVNRADVAQAGLFDEMLQLEITGLEELAGSVQAGWVARCERGIGCEEPPPALTELHARIAEAHRLRGALRQRFLLTGRRQTGLNSARF